MQILISFMLIQLKLVGLHAPIILYTYWYVQSAKSRFIQPINEVGFLAPVYNQEQSLIEKETEVWGVWEVWGV